MRTFTCLLLWTICVGASAGQSTTNQSEVRLFISALSHGRPVVTVERGQRDADRNRPKFSSRGWRTNYSVWSAALVEAAEKEHLDSSSLATILHRLRTAPANTNLAILPVEVHLTPINRSLATLPVGDHSTKQDGELVWGVGFLWEYEKMHDEDETLGHIRVFTFTQATLKQVGFVTCR